MADKILLIKPCLCIEYTCCLGEVNETELLTKFKIATTYLPSSKLKIRALIMLFIYSKLIFHVLIKVRILGCRFSSYWSLISYYDRM